MRREFSIGIAIELIGNGIGVGLPMIGWASPTLGWIIIGVSNTVGLLLIGYGLGKGSRGSSPSGTQLVLPKRKHLSFSHRMALGDIVEQMESVHGHSDPNGLEAEMLEGVPISDLMGHNCTRCFKPRNQRGDYVDE